MCLINRVDGMKVLVMMTSLQNIVISGTQGRLMLMGSKFLINMSCSESRGQEEAACAHLKAYATTTVSYLHGWQV